MFLLDMKTTEICCMEAETHNRRLIFGLQRLQYPRRLEQVPRQDMLPLWTLL
jgi:hypothetical protein